MKSMAARTGGRQSQRASMDGGPAGVEDCARSGPVGLEARVRVQGATTSLVMTRVKHHSWSWVRVVVRGKGVRRRRQDVVVGTGVGSASGDWGRRRLGGWSRRSELYGCDTTHIRPPMPESNLSIAPSLTPTYPDPAWSLPDLSPLPHLTMAQLRVRCHCPTPTFLVYLSVIVCLTFSHFWPPFSWPWPLLPDPLAFGLNPLSFIPSSLYISCMLHYCTSVLISTGS